MRNTKRGRCWPVYKKKQYDFIMCNIVVHKNCKVDVSKNAQKLKYLLTIHPV